METGFLNVYKPRWKTSHDIVAFLRKITGIKRIGHTGTLDPFAVGVLPVCVGNSTRLIEYLKDDKQYVATIQFGKNTDTYDIEGKIIEEFTKKISENEIQNCLKNFEGELEQYPPKYSAIKVNGKKLYEYARENKEIEIKPRKIFIKEIKLLNFDENTQIAKISVSCSKGTYIRSIAFDLGKMLGCGGFLTELERTKAGNFEIKDSIKLEELDTKDKVLTKIINPIEKLSSYPQYFLSDKELQAVSNGGWIFSDKFNDNDIVILIYGDRIKSVGIKKENKILVKKVL